jgi:hypothetical protein
MASNIVMLFERLLAAGPIFSLRPTPTTGHDHSVARAAFSEAVKRRPGRIITLRHKSRVLADSRR